MSAEAVSKPASNTNFEELFNDFIFNPISIFSKQTHKDDSL
jgi:hypothetical protein